MSPYTRAQYLERAKQAVGLPLIYWLGSGGGRHGPPGALPGTPIEPVSALAELSKSRPHVHQEYMKGLQRMGLRPDQLDHLACDCTGYLSWALGVPFSPQPLADGAMNTDSIVKDSLHQRLQFAPQDQVEEGDLLVYIGLGSEPGHVGIVMEAQAGQALKVAHCAPQNYEIPPEPGGVRSAICITDTALFTQHHASGVRYLRFKPDPA